MPDKNLNTTKNNYKKEEEKNVKFYLSPSFYGALIFSIALWIYTNLNEEFQTTVSIPLIIEMPNDKAIENNISENINIMVKGNGWNLFNLIFFNTAKQCKINLESKELTSDYYQISRQEIIKSIEYFQNIETRDVIPDVLDIYYGTIESKIVPIKPNINITTLNNFIISDSIRTIPSKIEIKGNKQIISKINEVSTEELNFTDLTKTINTTLKIKDSLSSIIEYSVQKVKVNIEVQQKSHLIIENIELKDYFPSKNKSMIPQNIKLIITGGVDDLTKLNINDLKNRINFRKMEKYNNYYLPELNTSSKFKVDFFPKIIKVIEKEKFII